MCTRENYPVRDTPGVGSKGRLIEMSVGVSNTLSAPRWTAVVTLIALLLIPPAVAQHSDQTVKLSTDLVTLDVAVTDRNGNFISGLGPNDFKVYEDGVIQPKLDFFEATKEAALTRPLAVVFAVDNSGSIKPEEVV